MTALVTALQRAMLSAYSAPGTQSLGQFSEKRFGLSVFGLLAS